MYIRPAEIYYSQDSIKNRFRDGKLIGETLDELCKGRCLLSQIPSIEVSKKGDKWFTNNNRRLWVFRQLGRLGKCGKVPVIKKCSILSMTTTSDGESIRIRQGCAGGDWFQKPDAKDLIAEGVPVSCQDVLSMIPNESCKKVLHVTVVHRGDIKKDSEHGNMSIVLVADTSAVLELRVFDMNLRDMMFKDVGIQMCNFIPKDGFAEVTYDTIALRAEPVVLPATILDDVKRVSAALFPESATMYEKRKNWKFDLLGGPSFLNHDRLRSKYEATSSDGDSVSCSKKPRIDADIPD